MDRPPRVTVVIPCFNLGQFVDDAVTSVFEQTYHDFDIVVVDDGSTDKGTQDRLAALAGRPRVSVVRSSNRGLSAARNLGIAHASGEYICALDADDRLRPAWLERATALLNADPELAFVSHWVQAFGDRSFTWTPVRCDLAALLDCNVVNGAALFRRSLIQRVGGFDESMREGCEDWEFWIRVTEQGHIGAIVPELLYDYRQRPDSMSRSMTETEVFTRLYGELVDKHRPSFERHLLDLVLRREWMFRDVCQRIDRLEFEVTTLLEPALAQRRRELATAKARLAAVAEEQQRVRAQREDQEARRLAEQRNEELSQQLEDARAEQERRLDEARGTAEHELNEARAAADALLASWSWRVTAPFRRVYERFGLGRRSVHDR